LQLKGGAANAAVGIEGCLAHLMHTPKSNATNKCVVLLCGGGIGDMRRIRVELARYSVELFVIGVGLSEQGRASIATAGEKQASIRIGDFAEMQHFFSKLSEFRTKALPFPRLMLSRGVNHATWEVLEWPQSSIRESASLEIEVHNERSRHFR
jgi:hypothetical protein